MESNWLSFIDTMMQYYLHVNSTELPDEIYAEKFLQIAEIRKHENKTN